MSIYTRTTFDKLPDMFVYKTAVSIAITGLFLAQEFPIFGEWTKLPIEIICIGVIAWITLSTMPRLFERQIKSQELQQSAQNQRLMNILDSHEKTTDRMVQILTDKMDKQTDIISQAIRDSRR